MNMHIPLQAVDLAPISEPRRPIPSTTPANRYEPRLDRMVELYSILTSLTYDFPCVPDDVCDLLGEAKSKLIEEIAMMPTHSGADVAWKLRLAAMVAEDDNGGPLACEADFVSVTVENLCQLRRYGKVAA